MGCTLATKTNISILQEYCIIKKIKFFYSKYSMLDFQTEVDTSPSYKFHTLLWCRTDRLLCKTIFPTFSSFYLNFTTSNAGITAFERFRKRYTTTAARTGVVSCERVRMFHGKDKDK
ncbi:hypothetical protein HW555_003080 [Spodoptera exigua]|uniref:Uncharacterized protein n=1 Tax=Spodoptera exigua TaxID=7107 RepID=A0A835L8S4_SPOEX|nr:hypothetical protein HW555_003080 [Spodoptera exigua]